MSLYVPIPHPCSVACNVRRPRNGLRLAVQVQLRNAVWMRACHLAQRCCVESQCKEVCFVHAIVTSDRCKGGRRNGLSSRQHAALWGGTMCGGRITMARRFITVAHPSDRRIRCSRVQRCQCKWAFQEVGSRYMNHTLRPASKSIPQRCARCRVGVC